MFKTKQVRCKVELEGVEVNFNSISIVESVGQAPIATVVFPANDKYLSVLPKTIIHVYYEIDNVFYLIFTGELSGYSADRSFDKKVVQLTFIGLTQNWQTNYVLPMDLSIPNMVSGALLGINYLNNSNDVQSTMFKFTGSVIANPIQALAEQLKTLSNDGATFSTVFEKAVNALSDAGVYLAYINKALKISDQTLIQDSKSAVGIVQALSVISYITEQIKTMPAATSVAGALMTTLYYIGFDYVEVAAPTLTTAGANPGPKKIFIKPKTFSFSPFLCNTLFNDDLQDFQFSRNMDSEPTRLISTTLPYWLAKDGGDLEKALIATVLPKGILVSAAIKNWTDNQSNAPDVQKVLFDMTAEERCRGINLSEHQDTSGIEEAYENSAFAKDKPGDGTDEQTDESLAEDPQKQLEGETRLINQFQDQSSAANKINQYHVRIGLISFLEQRQAARTATVLTTYSPYRMVGVPGLIIANDLPVIIGVPVQIQSTISADGQNNQSITYSHCRSYVIFKKEEERFNAEFAFMDDNYVELLDWYKEFDFANVKEFYTNLSGLPKKDLYSYAQTIGVSLQGRELGDQFNDSVKALMSAYERQNNEDAKATFIKNLTQRALVPESTYKTFIGTDKRSLTDKDAFNKTPAPYVTERIARVKEIFKKG